MKRASEFEKFDTAMRELLKVPHAEIKKKLDAAKKAKEKKTRVKHDDPDKNKN